MNATNEEAATRKRSNRTNVGGVHNDVDEQVDCSNDEGKENNNGTSSVTPMLNSATGGITGASAQEQNERELQGLQQRLRAEKTVEECIRIEPLAFEEDPIGQYDYDPPTKCETLESLVISLKPEVNLPNSPAGFVTVQGRADCFAPITMFGERGHFTGHVYQPSVNHRDMNFNCFHEMSSPSEGKSIPSLITSMVMPDNVNSFSMGNLMSFYCYEVIESNDDRYSRMKTPSAICVNNHTSVFGSIRGFRSRGLTRNGWRRTLEILGFVEDEDTAETGDVSAHEISSLFEKLGSYNLSTPDGLATFIEERKMSWLYKVERTGNFAEELNMFFALVRGLVPMRVAAYDGRHRFNLCCYFATGYFKPKAVLHMAPLTFIEAVLSPTSSFAPSFSKCAVFQSQTFHISQNSIASGPGAMDTEGHFADLRNSGVTTTASQGLLVETSWTTMIPEFVEFLITEKVQLDSFNFANFWGSMVASTQKERNVKVKRASPNKRSRAKGTGILAPDELPTETVVYKNLTKLWKSFMEFLNLAPSTRKTLAMGDSGKKAGCFDIADPSKTGKPFTLGMGQGLKLHPPTGVPKDLGIFSAILRLTCDDIQSLVRLRDLITDRESSIPQNPIHSKDKRYFRTMHFVGHWVFGTSNTVCDHLAQKYLQEKALIHCLIESKEDEAVKLDLLDTEHPTSYLNIWAAGNLMRNYKLKMEEQSAISHIRMKSADGNEGKPSYLSESDCGIVPQSTKMTAKVRFACQCVIFRDLMEGIIKLGCNPAIALKGEHNHKLHYYLSGFDFMEKPDIKSYTDVVGYDLDRNGLLLMLDLYYEYIQLEAPFDAWTIVGLDKVMPAAEKMNRGLKINDVLTGWGKGQLLNAPFNLTSLDALVPKTWLFTHFVSGVIDGTINVDEFPSFDKFMYPEWKKMLKYFHELKKTSRFTVGSFAESYEPPPAKAKEVDPDKKKRGEDEEVNLYLKSMKALLTFNGEVTCDPSIIGSVSNDSIGKLVSTLIGAGVVNTVTLDKETLKDLYKENRHPKGGISARLNKYVTETLEEKRKRSKKRKRSETDSPTGTKQKPGIQSPSRYNPHKTRQETAKAAAAEKKNEEQTDSSSEGGSEDGEESS